MTRTGPLLLLAGAMAGFLAADAVRPVLPAAAQQPAAARPPAWTTVPLAHEGGVTHWSAAALKKAHESSAARVAAGQPLANPRDVVALPMTRTHAWNFLHRYPRPQPPNAEDHEGVTDIYFITAGTGRIVVGGEIKDRRVAENLHGEYRGQIVEGGRSYNVRPGDVLSIPPNTPHITHPDPGGLTYMLLKVNVGMYPWSLVATQQPTGTLPSQPPAWSRVGITPEQRIAYWSAADLSKAHEKLSAAAAAGQPAPASRDLVELQMTRTHAWNLLHRFPRKEPPTAEEHAGVTDVYFITHGTGTIVVGGEIADRRPGNQPGEFRGQVIKGGTSYKVQAGDILSIPPNAPHLTQPDPGGVTYMLVKINVGMYPWSLVAQQQ
jgi:mannose-6-phosphate isomerase-like protein (cupin superfamily)